MENTTLTGTAIMSDRELDPIYRIPASLADPDTNVMVEAPIAKTLSYMFQVPMPEHADIYDMGYRFPKNIVQDMELQLEWGCVQSLTEGLVDVGTLLLLTNSPRCPYTLHTNSIYSEEKHYTYYRFILKSDIVKKPNLA